MATIFYIFFISGFILGSIFGYYIKFITIKPGPKDFKLVRCKYDLKIATETLKTIKFGNGEWDNTNNITIIRAKEALDRINLP